MTNTYPVVNLGQSLLQDVAFVVGAQHTPFRKLRQCQLEIRSLEDAVKQHEFTTRRNSVKISRLRHSDDELDKIELEELEWANFRAEELLTDAKLRLSQFELMRDQIIAAEKQEYWDAGYESAETEHWPIYFGKKMALEIAATGQPSLQTAEQVSLLPEEMKQKALGIVSQELPKLIATDS